MKKPIAVLVSAAALLLQSATAQTITEFYYSPQTPSFPVVVDGAGPAPYGNITLRSWIHASGYSFEYFPPSSWTGAPWTGLEATSPSYDQRGFAPAATSPGYGATTFQINDTAVGMHLNTFGLPLGGGTNVSLQYVVDFLPNRQLWTGADANRLLCVSGTRNIPSSYTAGSVNQVMITLMFGTASGRSFFMNLMMFDSRPGFPSTEFVMQDKPADTGLPIAISFMRSQGSAAGAYSSTIPWYGNPLAPFLTGEAIPGAKDFGACIAPAQFNRMITDINNLPVDKRGPAFPTDLSTYTLRAVIASPEIETKDGRGHVGMALHAMNVYRIAF